MASAQAVRLPDRPPRVGLVTVTYNSADVLPAFLQCVRSQDLADYLLVVIDNASTDRTREILAAESSDRVTVITNSDNMGFAHASNQGIEYCLKAGVQWILLINNDTEFAADLLNSLLASAVRLQAEVLVPRITYYEQRSLAWFAGGHFSWLRGFQARHDRERPSGRARRRPRRIECAPGCCMLVKSSVFDRVGLFDPVYFVYWEDADFCWRLKQRRISILYDPRIELAHKVSALTGGPQSPFSVRHYSRNQIYFLRKHFPWPIVMANVVWIRFKNRMRVWLGLDSPDVAALRRDAIEEGLRMPVEARRA